MRRLESEKERSKKTKRDTIRENEKNTILRSERYNQ